MQKNKPPTNKLYTSSVPAVEIPLRDRLNDSQLLLKCWKSIYRGKSETKRSHSKGIDGITLKHFNDNQDEYLLNILKSLQNNTYKINSLKGIPEPKPGSSKFRLITAATIPDRIVHKAILSLIHPYIFPYINTGVSYCGVKENIWAPKNKRKSLSTKDAIQKITLHVKNKSFFLFKTDIKGFYDAIPKRKLFNIVRKLLTDAGDTSLLDLIKPIIFFHLGNASEFSNENKRYLLPHKYTGISQGSPLSQLFANIYLADFDRRMKKLHNDRFIRYIDDFVVFFNNKEESQQARLYIEKILEKKGLSLSDEKQKTYNIDLRKAPLFFLGLKLDRNNITSKKSKDEQRKWILEVLDERNKDYRQCENHRDRIEHMNFKIIGLANYLRYYHVEEVFNFMNQQIVHKKRDAQYKFVLMINYKILSPIVSLKEWRSFFPE